MEIENSISSSEDIDNNDETVVENKSSCEGSVNDYVVYASDEEKKPLLTVHDKKKWFSFFTGNDSRPIYDHTDLEIIMLSTKHVAWVILTSMPVVIILSLFSYGYSRINFTNNCSNRNDTCLYYNREVLLYTTDILCGVSYTYNNICSHSLEKYT